MPQLHHFTLDPQGRRMRLALAEYGVAATLIEERPWQPSQTLLDLNPAGLSPVYVEDNGASVAGAEALTEYLEETLGKERPLVPGSALARAEVRRLVAWFDIKFYAEVTEPVLTEKVIRRFVAAPGNGRGSPDMQRMRAGLQMLKPHLDYLGYLAEQRSWLAGNDLSLADLAAAAHISAIDYLGEINWADHPVAQTWYSRIKSRPSFRVLLGDTIPGVAPAAHYAELDF
ncbi:glutathione S-transferase family protein [Aestuariivirga sp.]|uniref:glutathione S-transferase family protein n=1 Tax=Aestuariivirga sp. TaxID=2650926 RepID=UPI0039E71EDB